MNISLFSFKQNSFFEPVEMRFLRWLVIGTLLDQIKHRWYVFDQNKLQEIAKKVIEKKHPVPELFRELAIALDKEYPGYINLQEKWIFNNAGGAMGAMYILHCSITEYLIIFGSVIGTDGHSGRHTADDYFIILNGQQTSYSEGQFKTEIYKPGDMHHLPRGNVQHYRIPETGGWALEYARGWIPPMLPFGVIEIFTSTLDFPTLYNTFAEYIRIAGGQLLFMGKI